MGYVDFKILIININVLTFLICINIQSIINVKSNNTFYISIFVKQFFFFFTIILNINILIA